MNSLNHFSSEQHVYFEDAQEFSWETESSLLSRLENLKKDLNLRIMRTDEIEKLCAKVQIAQARWKKENESDQRIEKTEGLHQTLKGILKQISTNEGAIISREDQAKIQIFNDYFDSSYCKTRAELDALYQNAQDNSTLKTAKPLLEALDKIMDSSDPKTSFFYLDSETKILIDQFNKSSGCVKPRRQQFFYRKL